MIIIFFEKYLSVDYHLTFKENGVHELFFFLFILCSYAVTMKRKHDKFYQEMPDFNSFVIFVIFFHTTIETILQSERNYSYCHENTLC